MEVLESLRLRHLDKTERFDKEEVDEIREIDAQMNQKGLYHSGPRIKAVFNTHVKYAEKTIEALLDSIKELIDLGAIESSSEWKDKLEPRLNKWLENIQNGLRARVENDRMLASGDARLRETMMHSMSVEGDAIAVRMRRRFELMFFDETQRTKMNRKGPITIGTLNVTGIANLGEIIGDINQSINQVQSAGEKEIAGILKELVQAVLMDSHFSPETRTEAIENLKAITREASLPAEQRNKGIVRAALAYLPGVVSASVDIMTYLQNNIGPIKQFFGIP